MDAIPNAKTRAIPAIQGYNSRTAGVRGCVMISRGNLALLALLLFAVVSPGTAIKSGTVRITVLDSQSQSLPTGENDVPRDCDPTNYSAYCHSSKSAEIINTLVVQIGSEPPFRVTCTVETRWSRCIPLPKGETFDARKEKRGVLIYYEDDSGKPRSQLYTYVADEAKNAPLQPVPAAETQPAPVPAENPAPASPARAASTAAFKARMLV